MAVAIVGGGASGTMLAAQLARRSIGSVLIDGSGRMGRGVAYSTAEPSHLLNIGADVMSVWPCDPDHFARRFEAEGGSPAGFAQRRLFGRYLSEVLEEAATTGHVEPVAASAVSAARSDGMWEVGLDNGSAIRASALVLAIGNQRPDPVGPLASASRYFIGDPWGPDAQRTIRDLAGTEAAILLVGTGLTMVDTVLSLEATGHRGPILALSRRGLVPRAHADYTPAEVAATELSYGSVRRLWRWLRRRGAEVGWRAAIDSVRPHSHALWQSFDVSEQRRFLRHARPWWDVHRHRIAPEVGARIAQLVAHGRLQIAAGRIMSATETNNGLEVELRSRGSTSTETRAFAYAFNCTGPLHAIKRTRDPLLRALLNSGEAVSDQLELGLSADANSRVGERLWALGPLTKGRNWEIIAVPDIREQAAKVADDIARELQQ